jgi:hypothetical protein
VLQAFLPARPAVFPLDLSRYHQRLLRSGLSEGGYRRSPFGSGLATPGYSVARHSAIVGGLGEAAWLGA